MKKHLLLTLIIWLIAGYLHVTLAQTPKITLVHNGVSSFYTSMGAAYNAAVNNDTIYLPGGDFGTLQIDKKLAIIGAGYHPDSTQATGPTKLSVILKNASSAGCVQGIEGDVAFYRSDYSNTIISSYNIKRCKVSNITAYGSTGIVSNVNNVLFAECIVININNNLIDVGSIGFEKCIFYQGVIFTKPSAHFSNCIMYDDGVIEGHSNSVFTNNIFVTNSTSITLQNISYSLFSNNLFCTTAGSLTVSNWGTGNTFTSNLTGELAVNTFVNAVTNTFSYSNDYHLLPASPGNNFGTDGTDVGIYGTSLPWKDGGLPFNPHISSKTIGTQLSPTGNLSIDIKVTAQER